jgi:hypothetical protein
VNLKSKLLPIVTMLPPTPAQRMTGMQGTLGATADHKARSMLWKRVSCESDFQNDSDSIAPFDSLMRMGDNRIL